MKIKALVAVRSGSVRVKNKNIRTFADSNLLEIKLQQLLRIENLDGIIVNSNDDSMLKIAEPYGVECIKRDSYFASNEVSMSDVYRNMAENFSGDVVAYINVTNPLMKDETIFNLIEMYKNMDERYDSVNSTHLVKEFMWQNEKAFNYDPLNQPRSQDLPSIHALNFAVSLISKDKMIELKNVVGKTPFLYPIDYYEATDIDNEIDFEIAEYLFRKQMFKKQ